jgi:hypothetical protein
MLVMVVENGVPPCKLENCGEVGEPPPDTEYARDQATWK